MYFQNTHQQKECNMCQICDEALLAHAQAANMLASAAKMLYGINQSAEASTLAKAAAKLFEEPKVSGQTDNVSPNASKAAASPGMPEDMKPQAATATGNQPKGWHIDPATGTLYLDDLPLGRAVMIKSPVRH
jgi:hypothetical protein